jgi:hypothetical protein
MSSELLASDCKDLINTDVCHWYSDSVLSTTTNTEKLWCSLPRSIAGCRVSGSGGHAGACLHALLGLLVVRFDCGAFSPRYAPAPATSA